MASKGLRIPTLVLEEKAAKGGSSGAQQYFVKKSSPMITHKVSNGNSGLKPSITELHTLLPDNYFEVDTTSPAYEIGIAIAKLGHSKNAHPACRLVESVPRAADPDPGKTTLWYLDAQQLVTVTSTDNAVGIRPGVPVSALPIERSSALLWDLLFAPNASPQPAADNCVGDALQCGGNAPGDAEIAWKERETKGILLTQQWLTGNFQPMAQPHSRGCEVSEKPLLPDGLQMIQTRSPLPGQVLVQWQPQGSQDTAAIQGNYRGFYEELGERRSPGNAQGHGHGQPSGRQRLAFRCPQCQKIQRDNYTLQRHLRTHTRQKSIACPECGKKFKEQYQFISHMGMHSGKQPLRCEVSTKGFARTDTLTEHRRLHATARSYSCAECGQSFRQKRQLAEHRRGTGQRNSQCPERSSVFSSKHQLAAHLQKQ